MDNPVRSHGHGKKPDHSIARAALGEQRQRSENENGQSRQVQTHKKTVGPWLKPQDGWIHALKAGQVFFQEMEALDRQAEQVDVDQRDAFEPSLVAGHSDGEFPQGGAQGLTGWGGASFLALARERCTCSRLWRTCALISLVESSAR